MSIVLTMMVRDERDIVACNIAHHLGQGVSEVIVTDNGSVDGTRDLLADLARTMPLTIIDEPPSDWAQGRWVTRMARMAHDRFHARWVINGDADEFFTAPGSSLKAVLDGAPPIAISCGSRATISSRSIGRIARRRRSRCSIASATR
ncbi:MAG TPA: glycosyltransferase family 2 protein [Casimicrobiaceae bacterium]|nr:glycosyltransferase family 2 protein [Casimicrobiaceae bacterium]